MTIITYKKWTAKFSENPFTLKIVVIWIYLISALNFLSFCVRLLKFELGVFALAFGYIYWELANGLVGRSNILRIFALICLGLVTVFRIYIMWNGGTVSLDEVNVDLSISYTASIPLVVLNIGAMLILLHPQTRRLFVDSIQENVTQ